MRTQATLETLVRELQTNCGDMYGACRAANVSLIFVNAWMKDDKDVAAALAEAERVGGMQLESEAIRRAVHGVEKGVYFKGLRTDTETVYSDGLLQTLLKGKMRDRYANDGEGGGITVHGQAQINIMPRANNYEEWLRMKESTMQLRERSDAVDANMLPAPGQMIEGECVPVSPFEGLGL
jgi:hypothetical protein